MNEKRRKDEEKTTKVSHNNGDEEFVKAHREKHSHMKVSA